MFQKLNVWHDWEWFSQETGSGSAAHWAWWQLQCQGTRGRRSCPCQQHGAFLSMPVLPLLQAAPGSGCLAKGCRRAGDQSLVCDLSLGKAHGAVGRTKIPPGKALGAPSKASSSGLRIRAPRSTKGHIPFSPYPTSAWMELGMGDRTLCRACCSHSPARPTIRFGKIPSPTPSSLPEAHRNPFSPHSHGIIFACCQMSPKPSTGLKGCSHTARSAWEGAHFGLPAWEARAKISFSQPRQILQLLPLHGCGADFMGS